MKKPNDIPQSVWEEAENFSHEQETHGYSVREAAARAILAERERCAKTVELSIDGIDPTYDAVAQVQCETAEALAREIRKGVQP